jgi:hypothetical protein
VSTLASPPDNPIRITRDTDYTYVLPASEGLFKIVSHLEGEPFDNGDFTVTVLGVGRAASLKIRYTGAIAGGPEFHNLQLTGDFDDGSQVTTTLTFQVYPDGEVIPNITNASSITVAGGQTVQFQPRLDPVNVGTKGAENLPGFLSANANGVVSGIAPTTGSTNFITLTATNGGNTYKRYLILIVGDGGTGGGGGGFTPPGAGIDVLYDGDYTQAQIAGPPQYEIPFAADPRPYLYRLKYWQFFANFVEPALGTAGPLGGFYVGGSPGTIKQIGGGVIEFERQYALVPNSRNEYESFVYGFHLSIFTAFGPSTCLDTFPLKVKSRIQFDYFLTSDPDSVDCPRAPNFVTTCFGILPINGAMNVLVQGGSNQEIQAEDAELKQWKPGCFERRMRFVRLPSLGDIV